MQPKLVAGSLSKVDQVVSVLHSHAEPVAAWEKARDEEQSIANLEIAYTCLLSMELCPRRRHEKGARPGTLPLFSSKENMRTRLGYTLTLLGSRPMVSEEEEGHSRRANHHEVQYYVGAPNIGKTYEYTAHRAFPDFPDNARRVWNVLSAKQ